MAARAADDDAHGLGAAEDDEYVDYESDDENAIDPFEGEDIPEMDDTWTTTELWQGPWLPDYDDRKSGPRNLPKNHKEMSPLDFLLLLFPLYLLKFITIQTNLKALQEGQDPSAFMTLHEFCVYIGLHLLMMLNWSGTQDSYFVGKGAFDARKYMSRRRFYWIKRFLHFNDTKDKPKSGQPGYDPLFAVKPIIDTLNVTFKKYWRLFRYVSLDEMMIAFRGRNPFHRFIPRKPHPNGSKLHAIADAIAYYVVSFIVDGLSKMKIPEIAKALFNNTVVAGMTVITDRYYTCRGLVNYCMSRKIGFIGSCMSCRWMARKIFPLWTAAHSNKKERGDFETATNADRSVACVAWRDKGTVKLVATTGSTVRSRLKRRQKGRSPFNVTAPQIAEIFDNYYHGVDRNDQLRGPGYGLSLRFRAQKYTVKLFLGFLDIALSNAWILWRNVHPKDYKHHRQWMQRVAEDLIKYNPLGDPVYVQPLSEVPLADRHPNVKLGFTRGGVKRRRQLLCQLCGSTANNGTRRRASSGCQRCNVVLHPWCHAKWHRLASPLRRKARVRRRRKALDFDDTDPEYTSTDVDTTP